MAENTGEALFRLDGKVALITGAASGIGEQIARLYARQGAAVVVADRNEQGARQVAESINQAGGRALVQPLDVTDANSAEEAVRAAVAAFGGLQVLVNNAGIGYVGDALETEEAEYDKLMAVNTKGVFLCSRAGVRHMVEHGGGVIVNIASVAGQVAVSRRFAYGASKGAVIAMTKSMAMDFVDRNIRVNCICPGTIHTPFVDGYLDRFHKHNREETLAGLNARQPVGRLGRPEEVAYAALYLAADEAAFATGSALIIDGGLTAR
jgi:2-keto-3-deoxy-L-fuconate dehydrogenase